MNDNNAKKILIEVYAALSEGGYDPVRQIRDYLISGDPTYITDYNGARALVCGVDREVLLDELLHGYLNA